MYFEEFAVVDEPINEPPDDLVVADDEDDWDDEGVDDGEENELGYGPDEKQLEAFPAAKEGEDLKAGLALLPRGTILYKTFDEKSLRLLVEVPPGTFPINVTHFPGGRYSGVAPVPMTHEVAMPWQYFVFMNEGTWEYQHFSLAVFWSKHQIKSLDDLVMAAKIPDTDAGFVCLGNTMDRLPRDTPFFEKVTWTMTNFFGHSTFTTLHGGYNFPRDYESLEEWAKDSEKSPFGYLRWREWEENKLKTPLRGFFTTRKFTPFKYVY